MGPLRRLVLDAAAGSRALPRFDDDAAALALARIEAHYFVNSLPRRDSCSPASRRMRHLPCTIVQGRYDIVCPPVTADALARAWPEAEYIVVPDAGHSVREPGIRASWSRPWRGCRRGFRRADQRTPTTRKSSVTTSSINGTKPVMP